MDILTRSKYLSYAPEAAIEAQSPLAEMMAAGGANIQTQSGWTRGEILKSRAAAIGLQMPEGMIAGIPRDDTYLEEYMIGAIAAARRRSSPSTKGARPYVDGQFPDYDWYERIGVRDLAYLSIPVMEHIRSQSPDLVMAADRGGRYFGLAVYYSWNKRYPGAPFPTIDGKLHFGRISRNVSGEDRQKVMDQIVNRSGLRAEMMQRRAEGSNLPVSVLLLDDWVALGRTINMAIRALEADGLFRREVDFKYIHATMAGDRHGRDHIVGDPSKSTSSAWDNDNYAMGVQYGDDSARPRVQPTEVSDRYRVDLRRHINEYYS
jgi:hypothetical protein